MSHSPDDALKPKLGGPGELIVEKHNENNCINQQIPEKFIEMAPGEIGAHWADKDPENHQRNNIVSWFKQWRRNQSQGSRTYEAENTHWLHAQDRLATFVKNIYRQPAAEVIRGDQQEFRMLSGQNLSVDVEGVVSVIC